MLLIKATKQYIGRMYCSYPGEMAFPLASQTWVAKNPLSLANPILRQMRVYRNCALFAILNSYRHALSGRSRQ